MGIAGIGVGGPAGVRAGRAGAGPPHVPPPPRRQHRRAPDLTSPSPRPHPHPHPRLTITLPSPSSHTHPANITTIHKLTMV